MPRRRRQFITSLLAGAAVALGSAGPAHADLGDQLFKLLANDGENEEGFGVSVAISGTTLIVGADFDDDNGAGSGSAYLFDVTDPKNPAQIAKLLANDGAAGDLFGQSVAISGATAIVGALFDDDNGSASGSAYLFDTTTARQLFKLLPDDGAALDVFGNSVAISGATAIVGAYWDDDNGLFSGSAYLFDTTTGRQLFKLLPDDGAAFDGFGQSVAISGATAIVGTSLDDDNGTDSGSAYLFDATTGRQLFKLLPDDGAADDRFGFSVAISAPPGKEIAIVGAFADDDNGTISGSAYLFDISDPKNPVQIAKLLANDGAAYDQFGWSVAISGNPGKEVAIVGADFDADNGDASGSAYLFDTTTGDQLFKLLADDGGAGDEFGYSVGIGDTTAVIGAYRDDDNGTDAGSAYLFDAVVAPGKCPWDLDDSGDVGTSDLILLLGSWGNPYDTADLIELLGNWGPCPQ